MKKLLLSSVVAAATLIGCGQQTETSTQAPTLTSGIDLTAMDTSVRPGDDFNRYVNGTWIDAAVVPADKGSFSIFSALRDQSSADVRAIIEEAAENGAEAGSDAQKVGDMYRSYVDMETRNA